MKRYYSLYVAIFLLIFSGCGTPSTNNPEILQEELFTHVDFLSSDSLMGRKPGTPYDRVAAKYVKDYFEGNGFTLLGQKGYQFFEFIDHQEMGVNNNLSVNNQRRVLDKDFTVFPFSSSDTVYGPVVFVGYGLNVQTESMIWNDYQNLNLNGKWALILRGDPFAENNDSPFQGQVSDRQKAMMAKEHGAMGVLLVSGVGFDARDEIISIQQKTFSVGIPAIHITRRTANAILQGTGKRIENIEREITTHKKPYSLVAGSNVCARTEVLTRKAKTQNVIAMIEGKDPALKHQYVVVGAHLDHLGMGGKGSLSRRPDTVAVHNGADDNASGVAAMLEIAHKLRQQKNRRSVIFIAFAAEEMGLLGSKFFVDNSLIPLDSVVTMVNLDMLGRLNDENNLQVGGTKTALGVDSLLHQINEGYNFNLALSPQGYGPSDHASFYAKDIPVLFFTTGAHADYHTPNDRVEHINFEGLHSVSYYVYEVVEHIANEPERPIFQESGPSAPSFRHGNELKVRLGIMPDVSGSREDGLQVLAASENQPAALAGILKGDIITGINGGRVNNIQDYMFYLGKLEVGSTASIEFVRNGKSMVVLIQL